MSVSTSAPGTPTTPGTEVGSPATGVAGPGRAAPPAGRAHTVARVEDVPPGEGRAVVAGDVQVAVFRLRDGTLHATQAACPHAGGPLADGQTDPTCSSARCTSTRTGGATAPRPATPAR